MITVFFEVEGIAVLATVPQGWRGSSADSQEYILRELAVHKHPRGRKPSTPCHILHFDDPPVHNTEEVE
jgi:hypothetical protein